MYDEPQGTKLAIILAAGELFAEHGLEGTSIRPIAKKAGANVAAINYHFGSKENLYSEVLQYIFFHSKSIIKIHDIMEKIESIRSPLEISQFLYKYIKSKLLSLYSIEKKSWFTRLILQNLSESTSTFKDHIQKFFVPETKALIEIILRSDPNMTKQKAQLWAFSIHSNLAFYGLCKIPVLIILDKKEYDREFIEKVAEHVACTTITSLGLPKP